MGTTPGQTSKKGTSRNKEGSLAGDSDYTPAPAMSPALNLALPPVFKVATLASACDSSAMVNQASRLSVRLFPQISVVGAKHSLFFKKKIPFFLTLNSIVGHTHTTPRCNFSTASIVAIRFHPSAFRKNACRPADLEVRK